MSNQSKFTCKKKPVISGTMMADSNLENPPPIGFNWIKNLPDLPAPDKSEETQSPSFLLFGILNGISFVLTLACLGFTIFSQAYGNTDLNIFLWTTSGCAISLCLLEVSFCGFIILFACSTLVATCGIILYFLIGLGYAVFVIMTVMMENHPTNVNVYLIVNIGLGFARFSIMVRSIALSWV